MPGNCAPGTGLLTALLGALEFDVVAPEVDAVFTGCFPLRHLQWRWAAEFRIANGIDHEQIMRPDIENYELRPACILDDAYAVSSGHKAMSVNIERHFRDEVGLILFLDTGRVAGIVNHRDEHQKSIGKVNAAGVASLYRCRLASKENRGRQDLGCVGWMQDRVCLSWRGLREDGQRESGYRGKKNKKRDAYTGDEFHSLEVLPEVAQV